MIFSFRMASMLSKSSEVSSVPCRTALTLSGNVSPSENSCMEFYWMILYETLLDDPVWPLIMYETLLADPV